MSWWTLGSSTAGMAGLQRVDAPSRVAVEGLVCGLVSGGTPHALPGWVGTAQQGTESSGGGRAMPAVGGITGPADASTDTAMATHATDTPRVSSARRAHPSVSHTPPAIVDCSGSLRGLVWIVSWDPDTQHLSILAPASPLPEGHAHILMGSVRWDRI